MKIKRDKLRSANFKLIDTVIIKEFNIIKQQNDDSFEYYNINLLLKRVLKHFTNIEDIIMASYSVGQFIGEEEIDFDYEM